MVLDNWKVYMAKIDGFSTLVRINMTAKEQGWANEFPFCVVLTLQVLAKEENGFPTETELARLETIEQAILPVIETHGKLAVSLLSQEGTQDLIMFTDKPTELSSAVDKKLISLDIPEAEFQLGSPDDDDQWAWYDFVYPKD